MDADGARDRLGNASAARLSVEQHTWIGPLPAPADLAEYDSILPGAADRLISMAEDAASTQNKVLQDATSAEIDYAKTGQGLAFAITAVAFVAAIVFFALGNNYAGTALLSVPVVMLVRAFLRLPGSDRGDDPSE